MSLKVIISQLYKIATNIKPISGIRLITQQKSDTCSVAVGAMLLNALLEQQNSTKKLFKEEDLCTDEWIEAIAAKNGVGLIKMAQLLKEAMHQNKIKATIKSVTSWLPNKSIEKEFQTWLERLINPQLFIIVNYLPGKTLDNPSITWGHWAIIAQYNKSEDQVLILDPDPSFKSPYWLKVEDLIQGMKTQDLENQNYYRGYIVVERKVDYEEEQYQINPLR